METSVHNDPKKAIRAHQELMDLFAGHEIPREAVDDPVFRKFVSGERVNGSELWQCLLRLKLQQCMPAIQKHDPGLVPMVGGDALGTKPPVPVPAGTRVDYTYRGTAKAFHDVLEAVKAQGQKIRNLVIEALLCGKDDVVELFDSLANLPPECTTALTVAAGEYTDKPTSRIIFMEVMQRIAASGRIEYVNLATRGFAAFDDEAGTTAFHRLIACVTSLELRLELRDLVAAQQAHAQVLAEIKASFRGLLEMPPRPAAQHAKPDPSAQFAARWLGPDYFALSPGMPQEASQFSSGAELLFCHAIEFLQELEPQLHVYLCSIAPEVTDAAVRPLMLALFEAMIEQAFHPLIEQLYCKLMRLPWPLDGH